MSKKKKKEKIIYYDDYSTIADMSNVGKKHKTPQKMESDQHTVFKPSKWRTYWSAVRMMLIPCGVVLVILGVLYFFVMLISGNLF